MRHPCALRTTSDESSSFERIVGYFRGGKRIGIVCALTLLLTLSLGSAVYAQEPSTTPPGQTTLSTFDGDDDITLQATTRFVANTQAECNALPGFPPCYPGPNGLQNAHNGGTSGDTILIIGDYEMDTSANIFRAVTIGAETPGSSSINSVASSAANCTGPLINVQTSGVTIQDLTLNGTDATCSGGKRDIAISYEAVSFSTSTLQDTTIDDFNIGLDWASDIGNTSVSFSGGNTFSNNDTGIDATFVSAAGSKTFTGATFTNNTTGVNIDLAAGVTVNVLNSTFTNNTNGVVSTQTNGVVNIGSNTFTTNTTGVNIASGAPSVDNNTFDDNPVGIDVDGGTPTISNNTFNDSTATTGIQLDGATGTIPVSGNTLNNTSTSGIGVEINNPVSANLTSNAIGGYGVGVRDTGAGTVTIGGTTQSGSNTIDGNSNGIQISNSGTKTIQRNNITNNTGDALQVVSSPNVTIKGNNVQGNILALDDDRSGGSLTAYANNFDGNTTDGATTIASGSANVAANYWGCTSNCITDFATADWNRRLGADVGSAGDATANDSWADDTDDSVTLSVPGGFAQLVGNGTEVVIINHGDGQANTPFEKFRASFGTDQCSNYFTFYATDASGFFSLTLPLDSTRCTDNSDPAVIFAFDYTEDPPDHAASCTVPPDGGTCYWDNVAASRGDTVVFLDAADQQARVLNVAFNELGAYVAGDTSALDPTAITLASFSAGSASTSLGALSGLIIGIGLLGTLGIGTAVLRRRRTGR